MGRSCQIELRLPLLVVVLLYFCLTLLFYVSDETAGILFSLVSRIREVLSKCSHLLIFFNKRVKWYRNG
jgi:hypothetical protein